MYGTYYDSGQEDRWWERNEVRVMSEVELLNCRGFECPQPVSKVKKALEEMAGDELLVIVDNESASSNVWRFAESAGYSVHVEEKEGDYHLLIKRGKEKPAAGGVYECRVPEQRPIVVYINSAVMGGGDDHLGATLMGAFMETLLHFANDISHILLVNSGVKFTTESSPVFDHLRVLEEMGIKVLACGTCLKYFGLIDAMGVGEVSNMYSIVQTMSQAERVIRP